MHPVIEHLSARAGKSGPFSDGRRIALVLWGGIMRGVRGAGALAALEAMGLTRAFDSVYTVSAGFPLASYFLAGQIHLGISLFYDELASPKFLNRWRFWQGMEVPYLISAMREGKPLDAEAVLASPTRLYARVVNVKTQKLEYLEAHDVGAGEFWQLMHAAVSIPILHRRPAKISGQHYIDTNLNGRLKEHMRYALNTDNTDILVIYNAEIQRRMNAADAVRVYEFCPDRSSRLSRFERNPKELKKAGQEMADMVSEAFGHKRISL
ncbi:MAG: hypothetical protein M1275_02570 [Patescibacteria group bacterium]|nr:hypothetical protein [Patescibacteria group bacterium]